MISIFALYSSYKGLTPGQSVGLTIHVSLCVHRHSGLLLESKNMLVKVDNGCMRTNETKTIHINPYK